jgi:hypothetical protein
VATVLSVIALLGVVVLGAAVGQLYLQPPPQPVTVAPPPPSPDLRPALSALQSEVAGLKTQIADVETFAHHTADQLAAASAAPAAPPPGSSAGPAPAPSSSSSAPAASAAPATPAPSDAATAGLQKQLASLAARLDRLSSQTAQQSNAAPSATEVATLAARLDALAQRQSQDNETTRQQAQAMNTQAETVQKQLATLTSQTDVLAQAKDVLPKLAAKTDRLAEFLTVGDKLRLGQPLGTVQNAPPALARFAAAAPPTMASLRLSYADAARKAGELARPAPTQAGFWDRVWLRVSDLVVVRRGDQVLVGDPAAGLLAHVGRLVDAGDIAGAVAVLKQLPAPAAAAMAEWVGQAQSLIDAQTALAQMAGG